jgi:predicted acetyltransferase
MSTSPLSPCRWVPHTTLFLFASDNAIIAANVNIRHRLTPFLREEGGHIGYTVAPTFRRRGVGTALLALTLDALRRGDVTVDIETESADECNGRDCVLVTADADNVGSCKIIERNGGRLITERFVQRLGKRVRSFAVPLYPPPSAAEPTPTPAAAATTT